MNSRRSLLARANFHFVVGLTLVSLLAGLLGFSCPNASAASKRPAYGVSETSSQQLLSFDANSAVRLDSAVFLSGMQPNEQILDLKFGPASGQSGRSNL